MLNGKNIFKKYQYQTNYLKESLLLFDFETPWQDLKYD